MRRIVKPQPGERLAIRHGDVLLTVPVMHPQTPRDIRIQVFELVLRRLYGEALELATAAADAVEHREGVVEGLSALITATPHRNARGHGLAA